MIDLSTPCIQAPGRRCRAGYRYASTPGDADRSAHRLAYKKAYGPIPDGMQVDHVCHNADLSCLGGPSCVHRGCMNPLHLEAVTRSVNIQRGVIGRIVVCRNGHQYDEVNTYVRPNGRRDCRACVRERVGRYQAKKRKGAA